VFKDKMKNFIFHPNPIIFLPPQSNHQTIKSSNNRIIKPSNHQIIASSNHQIIK